MPKSDLLYFLGRKKPARPEKHKTAPGLKSSASAPCPKYPHFQNSLSTWQWILSRWARPCHVALNNLDLGVAKPVLSFPPLPNSLSHLHIPAHVWFRSPCPALSLTPSSNSHLMPWSTPISLYQNFDRTAKKMGFTFTKFVLLWP